MQNGGSLEDDQQIANHSSPRRTELYDRMQDAISLEVERIVLQPRSYRFTLGYSPGSSVD
jgi:hypothetical protein